MPRLPRYRLFEVVGLEVEYATVDADGAARDLVAPLFRRLTGRAASEVDGGAWGASNELTAHVFEVKNARPERRLADAEAALVAGVRRAAAALRAAGGARLLPGGMHPTFRPRDASLWPLAGHAIYAAYARIFPVFTHGFANVQSCHVNLPMGRTAGETVALYNAAAGLLPYLPAVAASSPAYEGRLGPAVCNRMAFYATNQRRIPVVAGDVIPAYLPDLGAYAGDLLPRIYAALRRVRGGAALCHEWVNSRGAILKASRGALEIRVLDVQECVRMDVAMAALVRGALRWWTDAVQRGAALPPHAMLVRDFRACVRAGTRANVVGEHVVPGARRSVRARDVLLRLLDHAAAHLDAGDRAYLPLVERRIRGGSLSERIRPHVARADRRGPAARRATLARISGELADCLERNAPWDA